MPKRGSQRPYVLEDNSEWYPEPAHQALEIPETMERKVTIDRVRARRIVEDLVRNLGIPFRNICLFRDISDKTIYSGEESDIKSGEELGIIIDPLAYYVPYHHYPSKWGIYFRIYKVLDFFERIMKSYVLQQLYYKDPYTFARLAWVVYVSYIYWHELAHHIIEDISSLKGNKYPFLIERNEEGLAEWHAFLTAENRVWPMTYRMFYHTIPRAHQKRLDKRFRRAVLSAIYYEANRRNDPIYRPVVRSNVVKTLGDLWMPVREASVRNANAYLVKGIEEVYSRVYLTRW
ncbi:MAG: hypothetical protein G5Z42_00795 [Caldisphaeraceae archaeon]|nr:hypothetical protein [Caldisphaeraceae archaeon]MEB3691893.1 hypothetical protein [Caldisphaeraceae archaeon]MEB3797341.1 hypothetical protein [Caldisphaeraceae archaeon]